MNDIFYRNGKCIGSVRQCDSLALRGEAIGGTAGLDFRQGDIYLEDGTVNPEYAWTSINTRGCGNMGSAVLRGKTRRARALIRQGKINHLSEKWENLPRKFLESCIRTPKGMEDEVLSLAWRLTQINEDTGFNDLGGRLTVEKIQSHDQFITWSGLTDYELTFPRVDAAICIFVGYADKINSRYNSGPLKFSLGSVIQGAF